MKSWIFCALFNNKKRKNKYGGSFKTNLSNFIRDQSDSWSWCLRACDENFAFLFMWEKTYIRNIYKMSPWWKITLLKWSFVSIFFISVAKVFKEATTSHYKWEPIQVHTDYLLRYPIWSGFALRKKKKRKRQK